MGEVSFSESATRALERIRELTGLEVFASLLAENPSSEQAALNLERWLNATANPAFQLQQLLDSGVGKVLLYLLGASQPSADSLIQNPELASLVLDPAELARVPTRHAVEEEGWALLRSSNSYSHSLDRLRFLKQRWNLPIVVNDLGDAWPSERVWTALSELAVALVTLALDVVWEDQKRSRGFDGDCPLMVVGFGKLGGGELNYSSDIDLVYVYRDGGEEQRLSRVCEALTRALSDRMGRGQLYRVDLRLRPFGGTGAVASSMRGIESYYELYAEPWEVQALLRSRPLAGPPELAARWEAMREKHCFRKMNASALEQSLEQRSRTEAGADADDIKRGAGGIRDVEFLVQLLQLAHAATHPTLRVRGTLDAIAGLEEEGLVEHPVAHALASGYRFLRQLEHRLQLVGDQQTHTIPEDAAARERLAMLMACVNWRELLVQLNLHRRTIAGLYQSTLHPTSAPESDREHVASELGTLSQAALQWFDEHEEFYASLRQNQDSLDRVNAILRFAPRLVPYFQASVALTEMLVSGEIEEAFDPVGAIEGLPLDASPRTVAEVFARSWTHVLAQYALVGAPASPETVTGMSPPLGISELTEALLRHCARRLLVEFEMIGLGSLALGEMGVGSDADLVLLVKSKDRHFDAETHAQMFLGLISQLKRLGAPIEIDLRLRPEGGKGLLVRTYEGFAQYELESMEMWERFALGYSKLVFGAPEGYDLVLKAAYAQPLTPERLKELLAMKKRIETERVLPQHVRRDVKLGHGGLSDVEWIVHLHEMRYPTATSAGEAVGMADRIRALARAQLINAIEAEMLQRAYGDLQRVRLRIGLQGLKKELLPENPDRLDRLALSLGYQTGNQFLARHEATIDAVRAMYREALERLKG